MKAEVNTINVIQHTLTLKMTTVQRVVETSVTVNDNSPIQDYTDLDDRASPTYKFGFVKKKKKKKKTSFSLDR